MYKLTIAQAKLLSDGEVLLSYLKNHSHESLDDIISNLQEMGYSITEISTSIKEYIDGSSKAE